MKSTEFGQARVGSLYLAVFHAIDDGRMVRSVAIGRPSVPMPSAASVAPRQASPHEPESVGGAMATGTRKRRSRGGGSVRTLQRPAQPEAPRAPGCAATRPQQERFAAHNSSGTNLPLRNMADLSSVLGPAPERSEASGPTHPPIRPLW